MNIHANTCMHSPAPCRLMHVHLCMCAHTCMRARTHRSNSGVGDTYQGWGIVPGLTKYIIHVHREAVCIQCHSSVAKSDQPWASHYTLPLYFPYFSSCIFFFTIFLSIFVCITPVLLTAHVILYNSLYKNINTLFSCILFNLACHLPVYSTFPWALIFYMRHMYHYPAAFLAKGVFLSSTCLFFSTV